MNLRSSACHPFLVSFLAIILVAVPAAGIIYLHTLAAPEYLVARMDTFAPGDPQFLYNDITPSNKTGVISLFDGAVSRPVTDGPVYLLFQPRVHSKKIVVELTAEADIAGTPTIKMGYRTAEGPQNNVLQLVHDDSDTQNWNTWRIEIPFDKMYREMIDARRLVFSFPHANGETWYIKQVRIRYE